MNVNRLLENSKRISLIGQNVYTFEGFHRGGRWDAPRMGLSGRLAVGHELPVQDALTPELFDGEEKLRFAPVRHRWTPAWTDTYYRCEPDKTYYPNAGCIAVRERKCISPKDVFVARMDVRNDKRESVCIRVRLNTPFEDGAVRLPIRVGALGCEPELNGFCAVLTDCGETGEIILYIPPNGSAGFSYAFAFSKDGPARAGELAREALEQSDPFAAKERFFNDFMKRHAPELICDEGDLLKAYYYRWFLVYRALHTPLDVVDGHPITGCCLYESPYGSWYGSPVGLPVPHHLEEAKWMRTGEIAFADAGNWLDGLVCYRGFGYIQYTPMAMWHLYENHPDRAFLERAYPICREYAMEAFRPEAEGLDFLPTIGSSWPTGAEYQPAFYQHTKTPWDWTQDDEGRSMGIADEKICLYRLDHICYSVGNLIGSANMARTLGRTDEAEELMRLAGRAIELLRTHFWCEKKKCFVSVDANTGKQCDDALCYDSFFPFLWDMVGKEFVEGWRPLLECDSFACDFSLTSADKNCPMYWFDNCIAGPAKSSVLEPHPYGCCWNGPVWPYAVSTVLTALGEAAAAEDGLKAAWVEQFDGYTELHFMEGDRSVPMITEHYRPTDGVSFSETCDYFHSTWVDLFMKYWAGVRVQGGEVAFEPFAACEFELRNVTVAGRTYRFRQYEENGKMKRRVEHD